MDFKLIAKELVKQAKENLKQHKIDWCGDKGMIEMFVDDYKDAKNVSRMIKEKKFTEATETIRYCDTASREVIYNMLESINKEFVTKYIHVH